MKGRSAFVNGTFTYSGQGRVPPGQLKETSGGDQAAGAVSKRDLIIFWLASRCVPRAVIGYLVNNRAGGGEDSASKVDATIRSILRLPGCSDLMGKNWYDIKKVDTFIYNNIDDDYVSFLKEMEFTQGEISWLVVIRQECFLRWISLLTPAVGQSPFRAD